ncbi:MAG: hypothetical protein Q7R83_00940 [bacterium]|nr:hypothetical protein [bacterium]
MDEKKKEPVSAPLNWEAMLASCVPLKKAWWRIFFLFIAPWLAPLIGYWGSAPWLHGVPFTLLHCLILTYALVLIPVSVIAWISWPARDDEYLPKGMRAWFSNFFQRNVVGYFRHQRKGVDEPRERILPRGALVPEEEWTQMLIPLGGWWHGVRIVFGKSVSAEKRADFSKYWRVERDRRRGYNNHLFYFLRDRTGAKIGPIHARDFFLDRMFGYARVPYTVNELLSWNTDNLQRYEEECEMSNRVYRSDQRRILELVVERDVVQGRFNLAQATIIVAIDALESSKRFMKSKQAAVIKLNLLRSFVGMRADAGMEPGRFVEMLETAEREMRTMSDAKGGSSYPDRGP